MPKDVVPKPGSRLTSFGRDIHAAVVGASGGVGSALVEALDRDVSVARVFAMSRTEPQDSGGKTLWLPIDIEKESTIEAAATQVWKELGSLHVVIVASGILHAGAMQPEKTWRTLDTASLENAFRINAIGPALVAKHFLPLLARQRKSVFAALSARIGSISDNRLGGWYAYRASKAALNMLVRTLSIELTRVNPQALCIGLHPGTVDTRLSRPFQTNVPNSRLFSPCFAADRLLAVVDNVRPEKTGRLFAWDDTEIGP